MREFSRFDEGKKESGSGHPLCRLPLLPSGPGGVQQRDVAQSHIGPTNCDWTLAQVSWCRGGERGIRTLGTFRYTRFPIVLLRPLGHLSSGYLGLAEREGFEPPVPLRVHLISNQAQST